ncbi:hypothetical protein LBMAG27_17760 [Bacteroidota bacterium]|nr:hypothetical protein LBMAG27_17760 [Bacteroidota bacterium]
MKSEFKIFIVLLLLFLFQQKINAQQFEAHSSQYKDFTSGQTSIEETNFDFDSTSFTMHMGQMNVYFGLVDMQGAGSNRNYRLLDKNDDTIYVTFNPRSKYIDYRLKTYYLRYILDKVKEIKPEVIDTSPPKLDSLGNELIIEDTSIYEEADVMPEFPGGKGEMVAFFTKNIHYPKEAEKNKTKGFVKLMAVVEKDGTLTNILVMNDIGSGCGAEAVRVVKTMPVWNPGENKGESVRVRVEMMVGFMPK